MADPRKEVLERLKAHLQTAILIELSTIPPYLCALYSIHGSSPDASNVRRLIQSVVQEEMLHMAMACNMLNAIGGTPVLNDPALLPQYPCSLPGHSKTANPFIVHLRPCVPEAVATFLQIELPEVLSDPQRHPDGWDTIGEFYLEIRHLLNQEMLTDDDFQHGRQVNNLYNPGNGVLYEVYSRADAIQALDEILDQGEGHSGKMFNRDHQLTHYWKFHVIQDLMVHGIWKYEQEVYPMLEDPDPRLFSKEAFWINQRFNTTWTNLMNAMHEAFNSDTPSLESTIGLMLDLKEDAIALMQLPLPGQEGNAGPTFTYLKTT